MAPLMVVALTPSGWASLRMPLMRGDGATVAQVGNSGPGQADLAHQLALKPHLPLLVRHLGQGRRRLPLATTRVSKDPTCSKSARMEAGRACPLWHPWL